MWLLLDATYLAHRSFYSTGGLSHGGDPTGVIYGVLRDVKNMQDRFDAHTSTSTVLCWDHGKSLREIEFPFYKESRRKKKLDHDQQQAREGFVWQVEKMKKDLVPQFCENNFYQKGYEGDDVIASVVSNTDEECVIVSGDEDMYQLLSPRVKVYHPVKDKLVTVESFRKEYNVPPRFWLPMKCIAGCNTDDVPGVERVGPISALTYIRHAAKPEGRPTCGLSPKIIAAIEEWIESEQYQINKKLVKLPYPGVKPFKPWKENFDPDGWRAVLEEFGIRSLV